jgi:rhodanese-related sulfurtransferase
MTVPHRSLACAAATLAMLAVIVDAAPPAARFISAPELAAAIMSRNPSLRVFDLRARAEFDRFHVPSATPATLRDLRRNALPANATAVVYANRQAHAARAAGVLADRGLGDVFVLREGLYEWIARVHEPRLAADATATERDAFARAATTSRFFGGRAHEDVPRAVVPTGYWTGATQTDARRLEETLLAVATIRRRGC